MTYTVRKGTGTVHLNCRASLQEKSRIARLGVINVYELMSTRYGPNPNSARLGVALL